MLRRLFRPSASLALLLLAACPPQEEPELVGVDEKVWAARERPAPVPPPPAEAEPIPVAGGSTGGAPAPPAVGAPSPVPRSPAPTAGVPSTRGGSARTTELRPSPPEGAARNAAIDGAVIYMKRCKNCHGVDGKAQTTMGEKHDIPDMTDAGWDRKWPLAKIVRIVTDGKDGTKMQGFSSKLTEAEIAAVSAFARGL